jgi:hypothetical protein
VDCKLTFTWEKKYTGALEAKQSHSVHQSVKNSEAVYSIIIRPFFYIELIRPFASQLLSILLFEIAFLHFVRKIEAIQCSNRASKARNRFAVRHSVNRDQQFSPLDRLQQEERLLFGGTFSQL